MGLAAVIQNDAFGMGRQQVDEGLGLGALVGRQGGIAHLHGLVCKAVGKAVGPGLRPDAVFGHVHPVDQAVQIGAAAQHHGGGGQGAGAAAALLEIKPCVYAQIGCQGPGHTGHQQHHGQHQRGHAAAPSVLCLHVCHLPFRSTIVSLF